MELPRQEYQWVAILFSRGSSPPRGRTVCPVLAGGVLTTSATWAAHQNRTKESWNDHILCHEIGDSIHSRLPPEDFGVGSVVTLRLGLSLVAQTAQNLSASARGLHSYAPWVGKIPWRREWQTHSTILAWRIPWTEEPGGLQCMGSQRVGHD